MSDPIDRQDVLNVLRNLAFDHIFQCGEYYGEDERQLTIINAGKAIDVIESLPSAKPERKTGKWEVQPSTGEDRPYIWWKCSECGHVIFSETERDRKEFHAFCGRCGADMRGEHGKA